MIKADFLEKSYETLPVLRGLSLNIDSGGIYGIAGRSGAGKSTLLRCINGLEQYDAGSLIVDGIEVKSLPANDMREFRKNIGMIFQNFSLLERLTVYENIALPLRCWKYKHGYIDKRVREILDVIGIPEKIHHKPRELSGGQKQRVAIGRALAMEPRILLCDEATSALDPRTAKTIISLLKEINTKLGITIVFISHQMPVIRELCRDMAIVEHGKIAVSGPVEDIFNNQPPALQNLMGDDTLTSDDMNSLIVRFPSEGSVMAIPNMAAELGIDLIIKGDKSTTAEFRNAYFISYSEKDRDEVVGYLLANNAILEEPDTGTYTKKQIKKSDRVYDPDIIMIQPETV